MTWKTTCWTEATVPLSAGCVLRHVLGRTNPAVRRFAHQLLRSGEWRELLKCPDVNPPHGRTDKYGKEKGDTMA